MCVSCWLYQIRQSVHRHLPRTPTRRLPGIEGAVSWAGIYHPNRNSRRCAGLADAMIAKDFPFMKDLHRVSCRSFVIM
jgi:hypothetical protein